MPGTIYGQVSQSAAALDPGPAGSLIQGQSSLSSQLLRAAGGLYDSGKTWFLPSTVTGPLPSLLTT